jgi:hypothetical protein
MNPKAVEALQKAKALFAHPAEVRVDDIPDSATPVEPIRKPRVVLIPTNAPKFDKETMKQEHKKAELIDKYVGMSTTKAVAECVKMGITKPSEIAKLTGKNINQIYTATWKIRNEKTKKYKSVAKKMPAPYECMTKAQAPKHAAPKANWETPSWEAPMDDFDPRREPTAYEDAHMVVLKNREQYEEEIAKLVAENLELKTIVKYLEGKVGK